MVYRFSVEFGYGRRDIRERREICFALVCMSVKDVLDYLIVFVDVDSIPYTASAAILS